MRIIAILNQKGGVGKTTTTINFGIALSRLGKKVCLIDLDPQANLTYSLGIELKEGRPTIFNLLKGEIPLQQILIKKENVDIVPATIELSAAEIELSAIPGREFLLKDALQENNLHDFLILDCPPSLGLLTLNALTAATEIIIPIQTEFLALQGLNTLLKTLDVVRKRLNKQIKISGVIGTRFDTRRNLNREVVTNLTGHFEDLVFNALIRENIALAEAPSFGQSIFEYSPTSKGAEDYNKLAQEYLLKYPYE